MNKIPNFPMFPPPPPPPPFPPRRQLNKKHRFKKKILSLIVSSVSGISVLSMVGIKIPLVSQNTVQPLSYTAPSQVLNKVNESKRLKIKQNLLARRETSSPSYLPNNPFGGMNTFGSRVTPKPSLIVAEAALLVDEILPELPLQTTIHEATINGRKYSIHLFSFNGTKYWHPYGNVVNYRFGQSDVQNMYAYVAEKFPEHILPEKYEIELDHAIPTPFADAMGIPQSEGVAVLVPKFTNAVRTNNKELVKEYTNFDWRLSSAELITHLKDGLQRLVYDRLNDSIVRNLSLYCYDTQYVKKLQKNNPNLNLEIYKAIYPEIAAGYNQAYIHDMHYYQDNFCTQFDISPTSDSSIFAFYNELVLQSMKKDFQSAERYAMSYFNQLGKNENKIIPEYFISQIEKTYLKQYKLSKQIQSFIPNGKYKKHCENSFNLQFSFYENLICKLIKNCEKNSELVIDTKVAKQQFERFRQILYTKVETISKQNLFEKIFTVTNMPNNIVLGNFYKKFGSGEILDTSLSTARAAGEVVLNKANVFTLKKNKGEKTMPQSTITPYQKEMLEMLRKSGDIALSSKIKDDKLNIESSDMSDFWFFFNLKYNLGQKNKDEFPSVPGTQSVEPRVTPDDERLARLWGAQPRVIPDDNRLDQPSDNQSQNVPSIQNN